VQKKGSAFLKESGSREVGGEEEPCGLLQPSLREGRPRTRGFAPPASLFTFYLIKRLTFVKQFIIIVDVKKVFYMFTVISGGN